MINNITTIQGILNGSHSSIPADLQEWLSNDDLIELANEAVQTFYWSTKTGAAIDGIARQHARQLLVLLTYCYASGNYSSDYIVDEVNRDGACRHLCLDCFNGDHIRRFRSQNSELLKRCLAYVLGEAWSRGGDTIQWAQGSGGQDAVRLKLFCDQEADRRFKEAVRQDSHSRWLQKAKPCCVVTRKLGATTV